VWFNYTSNSKSHITLYDGVLVNNELEGAWKYVVVTRRNELYCVVLYSIDVKLCVSDSVIF